jgi:hypothetical protein
MQEICRARRTFLSCGVCYAALGLFSLSIRTNAQAIFLFPAEISKGKHGDVFFYKVDEATGKTRDLQKIENELSIDIQSKFYLAVKIDDQGGLPDDDFALVFNYSIYFSEEQANPDEFGYRRFDLRDPLHPKDSASEEVDDSLRVPTRVQFLSYHNDQDNSRDTRLRLNSAYTVDDLHFSGVIRSSRSIFSKMVFLIPSGDQKFIKSASTMFVNKKVNQTQPVRFDFGDTNSALKIYVSLHMANLNLDRRAFVLKHNG